MRGRAAGWVAVDATVDRFGATARNRTFYALVLPENLRMLNLLRDLGLPQRIRFEGTEISGSKCESAGFGAEPGLEVQS